MLAAACRPVPPLAQCSEAWVQVGGFCRATCGQCAPAGQCRDNQPAGAFTCAQQKAWGKASRPGWLEQPAGELPAWPLGKGAPLWPAAFRAAGSRRRAACAHAPMCVCVRVCGVCSALSLG